MKASDIKEHARTNVLPNTHPYSSTRTHIQLYEDTYLRQHRSAYVSIRQHTSAYVQHALSDALLVGEARRCLIFLPQKKNQKRKKKIRKNQKLPDIPATKK